MDKVNSVKPNPSDLYNRLHLFGRFLNEKQKRHLLLAVLYNDLRLFEDSPEKRLAYIRQFLSSNCSHTQIYNEQRLDLQMNVNNWQEQIIRANYTLSWIPGTKPLERAFILNKWLVEEGFCPLVHFAFDQWYEIGLSTIKTDLTALEYLVDLSTTYLYRLIPVSEPFVTKSLLGVGAYTNVYRSNDGFIAHKVPKNMASYYFASEEEYKASRFAEKTDLAAYIPRTLRYNPQNRIIERELITGTGGIELLQDPGFRSNPFAIDDLRGIYDAACSIYTTSGINFDIHPGNIMWSKDRKNWVLVDLGPMPYIGAEYFPRDSFELYFKKIWLSRNYLMDNVPFRSLNIVICDEDILGTLASSINLKFKKNKKGVS